MNSIIIIICLVGDSGAQYLRQSSLLEILWKGVWKNHLKLLDFKNALFCGRWRYRTLILVQRYMPSKTLFTFLRFKRKFLKSLSGAISTFRWNKRCGESGYSGARDLMAVSFNQEKPFFSSAIIWQEIWMDFSKLER